jgi:hypothetical protein
LNKIKYEEKFSTMKHLPQEEKVIFHSFKAKKRVNKYTRKTDKKKDQLEDQETNEES